MRRLLTTLLSVAAVWLGTGCKERPRFMWEEAGPEGEKAQPDTALARQNATREPGALATVQGMPVERWTGPGNRPFEVARRSATGEAGHTRLFGTVTLTVSLRSRAASINQYPCTSCHLGRRLVMARERISDAHNNIQPVHPSQTGAVCFTCHAEEDVALLQLKGGERVTLDESYRLCAQCHFVEADAWAGGGHGKRLDGWQGRRVVMACADCHDPHSPAAPERIPFRAPEIERTRRVDP